MNTACLKVAALPVGLAATVLFAGCVTRQDMKKEESGPHAAGKSYLPNAEASKVVSVVSNAPSAAVIVVQTQAVAVKEIGPRETVAHFGEVYAFSPSFIAVHRNEPTLIRFWNLQPDDEHDFTLIDPSHNVLMKIVLPPLRETAFVFTFHQEGLFDFVCAMHRPEMNGQILVLPPRPQ